MVHLPARKTDHCSPGPYRYFTARSTSKTLNKLASKLWPFFTFAPLAPSKRLRKFAEFSSSGPSHTAYEPFRSFCSLAGAPPKRAFAKWPASPCAICPLHNSGCPPLGKRRTKPCLELSGVPLPAAAMRFGSAASPLRQGRPARPPPAPLIFFF